MSDISKEQSLLIKEKRRVLSKKLNPLIAETGQGFNPSLNAMLLYGGILHLTEEARTVLKANEEMYPHLYRNAVIPRITTLVRSLAREPHFNPTETTDWSIEQYRNFLKVAYFDPSNHYRQARRARNRIDDEKTLNTLLSKDPLPKNHYQMEGITYLLDKKHGILVTYREKEIAKLSDKQKEKVSRVIRKDREEPGLLESAFEFIQQVAEDSHNYWQPEVRADYLGYDSSVRSILVGDNLGVRILHLDRLKAVETQKTMLSTRGMEGCGFNIVHDRVEDHNERRKYGKPGGVHITLTDKGMHLPVEVQDIDVVDAIIDKFGEEAHFRFKEKRKETLRRTEY